MLIILLIFIIILLFISYYLTEKDIFSPPCIICEGFIVSIIFACYNWTNWELWKYSVTAAFVLLLGIISFILGSLVSYTFVKPIKQKLSSNKISIYKPRPISVNVFLIWILAAYECSVCLFYYRSLQNIVRQHGYGTSVTNVLYNYNQMLTNNMLDAEATGSFLLRQSVKICYIIGTIIIAIAINNIIVEGAKRKHLAFLVVLVPSIFLSLIGSTRINIFKFVAFFITVFNIVYHRMWGWNRIISVKFIFKFLVAFAGILAGFTGLRNVMGRGTRFDPMYYISVYAGGSIKLFDMYINSEKSSNMIFGQETFYSFFNVLHRFGIIEDPYKRLEFRSYNNYYVGNVYTAFRRYYNDFGIFGMILVSFILGLVLMFFYIRCKNGKNMWSLLDLRLILFAMVSWGIYLISIDECMLSTCLSILYLTYIVIMTAIWILFKNFKPLRKGKIVIRRKSVA